MKAILRELEIGVRCEREITPKRENTGNTLEELRVCGVCVCVFFTFLAASASSFCRFESLTPSFRSEIDSWPQHYRRRNRKMPPLQMWGKEIPFRSKSDSCLRYETHTCPLSFTHTQTIYVGTLTLTLTHLQSLMHSLQFPPMDRHTDMKQSGNKFLHAVPRSPCPHLLFPLKHCLFILDEWKKNTLSFCTHTLTQKTGDFQPLRNSSIIAGALLSIKTWPFQHVCAVLGAVGTGKEEDRGLPGSVVVWPSSLLLSLLQLPQNSGDSHCVPVLFGFGGLEGRIWLTHKSGSWDGDIKGRTGWCEKGKERQSCPVSLWSQEDGGKFKVYVWSPDIIVTQL